MTGTTGSSYTRKNLADIDDSAPKFGFADNQMARFANEALKTQGDRHQLPQREGGQASGVRASARRAEEVYVVLAGSGRLKLDDEIIDVGELDAIRVAPGVTRQFEAGGQQLDYLAFGPQYQGDGEIVHDWWTE